VVLFRRAFVAAAVAWAALLPIATALRTGGPSTLAWAVYLAGSLVCHQRPERSFQLLGMPMPVCARCTGIYVAGAVMALLVAARLVRGVARARGMLLLSVTPTLLTLAYEWLASGTPSNWTRALAGAPIGAAVSWVVVTGSPRRMR